MTGHLRSILHSAGSQIFILPDVCSVPIKAAVNKQHLATFPDQDRGTVDCRWNVSALNLPLSDKKNIKIFLQRNEKLPQTLISFDLLNRLWN